MNDRNAERFSILNRIDSDLTDTDGKFHFKLVWPQPVDTTDGPLHINEWKQTNNPFETTTVTGFEPVNISTVRGSSLNGLGRGVSHVLSNGGGGGEFGVGTPGGDLTGNAELSGHIIWSNHEVQLWAYHPGTGDSL